MADVTLPNWLASDGGRTGRNRGQLVLLSGLVLATIFVALVLILNSAIYTENLATRNDGVPTTDAIEYRENTRQGIAGAIEYVNRHARSRDKGDHRTALNESIANWTNRSLQHVALNGRAANVTLDRDSVSWGTRIGQNADRNFTSASGAEVWTLANETNETTSFRMNINRSGLDDSDRFGIQFANSSGNWDVLINRSNTSEIRVEGPNGAVCSVASRRAELDVVAGTIRNATNRTTEDCPAVDFFDPTGGKYNITYENAANITGVYELSIRENPGNLNLLLGDYAEDSDPYFSYMIYEATVDVSYESPSLRYESNVTVEPHDSGTIRPTEGTT